ncbi:MAG: hypothetical protein EZS28_056101, partial [Streblomastix strix]
IYEPFGVFVSIVYKEAYDEGECYEDIYCYSYSQIVIQMEIEIITIKVIRKKKKKKEVKQIKILNVIEMEEQEKDKSFINFKQVFITFGFQGGETEDDIEC